ncbi:hypothetical protein I4F81_012853 [Pyropia yezoensis]|uniref:Uncharacterized protein n=1 Tax=Pyropia yezoensis TaxID=2788 RepID=A0ACC3CJB8_PYRYE|nr:hypothetical protein I4F81_012853 [Neopyropia yezoensis]
MTAAFPYALDGLQRTALRCLVRGRSVLVSAPTSGGKMACGEAAVYLALARRRRAIYTTPLKAMSNQKVADFAPAFGAPRVGLLTGDAVYRRDADVLVMTTEIYRSILLHDPPLVAALDAVVLDEFHYMADPDRGTVWEESVIHTPPGVSTVALSATVSNLAAVRDWVAFIHGRPTDAVVSARASWGAVLPLPAVVGRLERARLLPAIVFVFFRAGCDAAAAAVAADAPCAPRLPPETAAALRARLDEWAAANPAAVGDGERLAVAAAGVAAHHAGLLGAWKAFVEAAFADGLLCVIFATETLAAGVNLPARTTVLTALAKRGRGGVLGPLPTAAALQMAGRVGRRGMDAASDAVVLRTPFDVAADAARIVAGAVAPLESHFLPTFGMVLNLLAARPLGDARQLMEKSLGSFWPPRSGGRRRTRRRTPRRTPRRRLRTPQTGRTAAAASSAAASATRPPTSPPPGTTRTWRLRP